MSVWDLSVDDTGGAPVKALIIIWNSHPHIEIRFSADERQTDVQCIDFQTFKAI